MKTSFALLCSAITILGAVSVPLSAQAFTSLTSASLSVDATTSTTQVRSSSTTGTQGVVGGTLEPDYKYPWVVHLNGCGAVVIDPQWVLTAAHCVTPGIGFGSASYKRTDPYTNSFHTERRYPSQNTGPGSIHGVFIHPEYDPYRNHINDIALIKLERPFTVSPYLQTVGLPTGPRIAGISATLASFGHNQTLPEGQVAVFRAPMTADDPAFKIYISANSAGSSLCPGDSGSGLVTLEGGRAVVRGVASQATVSDCLTPTGEAVFTDVFTYRAWILQTMGKSSAALVGNTRVRWAGRAANGVMGLGCTPINTQWGPLNVKGILESGLCDAGETQAVVCKLDNYQPYNAALGYPAISGFSMRTTFSNGTSTVTALPFSSSFASYYGTLPAGVSRDFKCTIGSPLLANLPVTGVLLQK